MKTIANNIFCTLLLLITCGSASFAQSDRPSGARVSGLLLNEQLKPLNYAVIALIRITDTTIVDNDDIYNFNSLENTRSENFLIHVTDSTVVKDTLSNKDGMYAFENIKPGKYFIKASVPGYSNATTPPFVITDDIATANTPTLTIQTSSTALEVLAKAPGVTIDKDNNICLQGQHGVTVMINNNLPNLSVAQLAHLLRSTNGNAIKSIEIITNPSAKYDAAGNSSIINIRLKDK